MAKLGPADSQACDLPSFQFVSLRWIHQFMNLFDWHTETAPLQATFLTGLQPHARDVCLGARLIRSRCGLRSPGNKTLTILLRLERGGAFLCSYIAVKITKLQVFHRPSCSQEQVLILHTTLTWSKYPKGCLQLSLALGFHKKDFNIQEDFEVVAILETHKDSA